MTRILLLTFALLAVAPAASVGPAVLSSTAVAIGGAHYGYVGNRTSNTVSVFDPVAGGTPALLGAPASPITVGAGPNNSVAVVPLNRVYIADSSAGTISVISGDTLSVVNTISLPNAGGAGTFVGELALSEDGTAIFVAGHTTTVFGQAGIWRIDLPGEIATYLAGVTTANPAQGCEVIRAAQVGGTGDGPGKVYFSIPASNEIWVYNALTSTLGATPLTPPPQWDTPRNIERAPDHSFLLLGVSSNLSGNCVGKIIPGPDTVGLIDLGGSKGGDTTDVVFRPAAGPSFQVYVCGFDVGGSRLFDFSASSATVTVAASVLVANPMAQYGLSLTLDPDDNTLWLGDSTGTSFTIQRLNAAAAPPTLGPTLSTGTAGPSKVAFLGKPKAPTVEEACPKGQVQTATSKLRVQGKNFQPNTRVGLDLAAAPIFVPTTYIDGNTLEADVSGIAAGLYDVVVQNRDLQQARLNRFYQSITAPGATPGFLVNLPPFAAGYEMRSFPQYATIDDLRQALQLQLGPYNPVFYRVFFWYQDHYVELDKLNNSIDPCDLSGRAFFVLTRFGQPLTLAGPDVTGNASGTDNVVPLAPGWNMISQPWLNVTHTIPWGGAVGVDATLSSDLSNPIPADTAPFLSPLPYEHVGHQYVNVNALTAGRGYWIHNGSTGWAYLIFRRGRVAKPGSVTPVYTSMAAGDPGPPPPPDAVAAASSGGSGGGGGCGLLGPELLLLALAFHRGMRRRRLGA